MLGLLKPKYPSICWESDGDLFRGLLKEGMELYMAFEAVPPHVLEEFSTEV